MAVSTIDPNGLNVGQLGGTRSVIINGDMSLDQRNSGSAVTATTGNYCLDRYRLFDSTDGAFTAQQVSDAPAGFTYSTKITVTTADASVTTNQQAKFQQRIEGYNIRRFNFGTSDAVNMTLSFWVKSSVTGTFAIGFMNNLGNRSYVATYDISSANTWEYKTITLPADNTGTWENTTSTGLNIQWSLGIGPTYQGAAGSWLSSQASETSTSTQLINTLNATWQITGVQLEVGDTATDFEHESYGTTLQKCLRYFCTTRSTTANIMMGLPGIVAPSLNNRVYRLAYQLPVRMRAAPSATFLGTMKIWDAGNSVNYSSAASVYANDQRWEVDANTASDLVDGRPAYFYQLTTSDYINFDAEL